MQLASNSCCKSSSGSIEGPCSGIKYISGTTHRLTTTCNFTLRTQARHIVHTLHLNESEALSSLSTQPPSSRFFRDMLQHASTQIFRFRKMLFSTEILRRHTKAQCRFGKTVDCGSVLSSHHTFVPAPSNGPPEYAPVPFTGVTCCGTKHLAIQCPSEEL